MLEIIKYKIELVKESSSTYDVTNENIKMPYDIYRIIKDKFKIASLTEEMFGIICLDTKNKIVGAFEVSRGCLDSTMVHPREVFKRAMLVNSARIILFHNHPSEEVMPSLDDINITKRLVECGKLLGINIMDHIIVSESNYLSFKELNPGYINGTL
jgi:DNA repair protein RadC